MNRCKYRPKFHDILYNHHQKLGSNYPDLEPGKILEPGTRTQFQLQITNVDSPHCNQ